MAPTRRLPLPAVLAATAIALVAALATFAVLDRGDDGGDGAESAAGDDGNAVELLPAGETPASLDEIVLTSLDGGADGRLGDLRTGAPMVINFFSSTCVPCVDEMPAFERVHRDVADHVTIVGLGYDSVDGANETVAATGVTYPTFGDPDGNAITYFGSVQLPTTVFVDAAGTVVDVQIGALTEAELRSRLADLYGVAV